MKSGDEYIVMFMDGKMKLMVKGTSDWGDPTLREANYIERKAYASFITYAVNSSYF
jgi:hypothetical protein